ALDDAFASIWRRAGAPLPPDELEADPVECGSSTARVVSGVPGRARMYRAVQLLTASATDRLWITDAYLIAPPPLYASLLDAARAGVDVRPPVPGTSDLPVLRDSTRIGYRDLLRAGARSFESQRPMLHATAPSSVPEQPHKRSGYELGAVAVVTVRRVAGGLRRAITSTAALVFAGMGGLLLAFPRVMAIVLATGAFSLALAFAVYTFERR